MPQPKPAAMMLFSLLLLMMAAALAQEDCPNEASECPDVCGGGTDAAKCGRFVNAECRVNPCYSLCAPNFFWRGRNMTDRCAVERCADKVCVGKRQCVEETVPASCPEGRPMCRQYIRAKCMLLPQPTDCSQLTCGPGMYCREKRRGEGVTCARIRNCNQLTCSDGLSCTETDEGPKCVDITMEPATTATMSPVSTPFPDFCSFCERFGQVCEVVNGTYECIDPAECIPARVDYCLSINGQLCEEKDGKAECVFAESCNDTECPQGFVCEEFSFLMIAYCNQLTTAETCDELDCESIPNQVCEQRNDSAVCVPGCNENDNETCKLLGGRCEVIDGVPQCVVPSTCDELECDPGFQCIVVEAFTNDTQDIATCIPELKAFCEESSCPSNQFCYQQNIPSLNFSFAQCLTQDVLDSFPIIDNLKCSTASEPLCMESEICTDVYENGQLLSFVCNNYTTDCTDDTSCESDQVCTDLPSSIVSFSSICLPKDENIFKLSVGSGCASSTRQCPSGFVCQDVLFGGMTIGTSCGVTVPNVIGGTCAELECVESYVCVEGFVLGRNGLAQCLDEDLINTLLESLNPI